MAKQPSGDRVPGNGERGAEKNSPFDDVADDAATKSEISNLKSEIAPAARGRQGDDGKPFCPLHNCLLVATSTKGDVTYYGCPVPGCTCKEKKARPNVGIPAKPQYCPNKTCRGADDQPNVALEVSPERSAASPAQLTMICPQCHWETKVPRPTDRDRLLQRAKQQQPTEDLAAR